MVKIAIKEFNKQIGYRMRLRRKILKLPLIKVAKILDVSPQCIQNYESGTNSLNIFYLYKLAIFYGVDINYFFYDIKHDLDNIPDSIHLQEMLKNFTKIKDKKIAQKIEDLIFCISTDM